MVSEIALSDPAIQSAYERWPLGVLSHCRYVVPNHYKHDIYAHVQSAVTLVLNVVSVFKVKVLGDYSFVVYVYQTPHEMAHFISHQIIYRRHKYLCKCINILSCVKPE